AKAWIDQNEDTLEALCKRLILPETELDLSSIRSKIKPATAVPQLENANTNAPATPETSSVKTTSYWDKFKWNSANPPFAAVTTNSIAMELLGTATSASIACVSEVTTP